jgi:hypothetical protein
MAATVTVTGTAGPGNTVTAGVFQNVTEFTFDCVNNLLSFKQSTTTLVTCISIAAATTITATKSGSTYTLVVS